ncbi:MAG: hypothetical protein IBX57_06355 [Gammaproteobacteria bacterium]|nr:hypothetical protein [Gammaproteobacteria bacterium]
MRIKHKFIIVGALILVSIASSLYIDHYKVTNISNFSQIALKISEVRADMLQLRRNEKDFLARTDIKYRDTFAQNYQKLVNETNQLAVAVTDAGLEFTQLQELEPLFQRYHDRFMALVALQQTMGFSYDDGLYGQLREAVHVVEQEIQAQDDQQLRADMLQLRRNEKDFLLRLQPKYSDQFNKNLIVFKQDIADSSLPYGVKQTINKHVDDYNNAFVTLTDNCPTIRP